jgi:acetoin utilization deacetylase AcuC-like enzyme
MNTKKHLVFSPLYQTDLTVLGSSVPFAPDRGARVLKELSEQFGHKKLLPCRVPRTLTFNQLRRTHDQSYLDSLKLPETWASIFGVRTVLPSGEATARILRRLLYDYRLKSGGTLLAAKLALKNGMAANLGGGYHHGHRDRGDGFCVINDIALAIHNLRALKLAAKVMVVDLDFHQGNGVSTIFANDDNVFTLDFHALEAWPMNKQKCSLAVAIRKDESDLYNAKLEDALARALSSFTPDLVIFVHGADAYEHGLHNRGEAFALTLKQMDVRDRMVIDCFRKRAIPLALCFAGGYGERAWEAHHQAVAYMLTVIRDGENGGTRV